MKDKVDFVVWTGDAVRHDRDDRIPRVKPEVIDLNKFITNKMIDTFSTPKGKHHESLTIPIVPTIGNNDIMPHNIFEKGPNEWTKAFRHIWHELVPEEQRHTFEQGGWFYVEVVPDKLAVISLNTMYFYKSNSAVGGCNGKSGPGYAHMEWLRIHLQFIRDRGMKAILIGHVPPVMSKSKRNWYKSCWQKHSLWTKQYRDVIVGSVYGHMNIDHFVIQDFDDIKIGQKAEGLYGTEDDTEDDGAVSAESSNSGRFRYLHDLLQQWKALPSPPSRSRHSIQHEGAKQNLETQKSMDKYLEEIGGPWGERYAISLVSPSVIPCYFPTLRVIEYNITGLENTKTWTHEPSEAEGDYNLEDGFIPTEDDNNFGSNDIETSKKKKKKKKKKRKKKKKFPIPKPPPSTAGPGPAYHNQPFTWLGYTQYYSNLTEFNDRYSSNTIGSWKVPRSTWREYQANNSQEPYAGSSGDFKYEIEYDTRTDPAYKLEDLTINSYLDLARRIAANSPEANDDQTTSHLTPEDHDANEISSTPINGQHGMGIKSGGTLEKPSSRFFIDTGISLWKLFLRRAFVGYLDDEDLIAI